MAANTTITIATVNKYLKAAGHDERLVRGNGYFYFVEGNAHCWPTSSVPVCHLSQLSVGDWLKARDDLEADARLRRWI